jgi:hypothetical protein
MDELSAILLGECGESSYVVFRVAAALRDASSISKMRIAYVAIMRYPSRVLRSAIMLDAAERL